MSRIWPSVCSLVYLHWPLVSTEGWFLHLFDVDGVGCEAPIALAPEPSKGWILPALALGNPAGNNCNRYVWYIGSVWLGILNSRAKTRVFAPVWLGILNKTRVFAPMESAGRVRASWRGQLRVPGEARAVTGRVSTSEPSCWRPGKVGLGHNLVPTRSWWQVPRKKAGQVGGGGEGTRLSPATQHISFWPLVPKVLGLLLCFPQLSPINFSSSCLRCQCPVPFWSSLQLF